jgi:hypothetical protein
MLDFNKPPTECPNCHINRQWYDKGLIPKSICSEGCGSVDVCRENAPEPVSESIERE